MLKFKKFLASVASMVIACGVATCNPVGAHNILGIGKLCVDKNGKLVDSSTKCWLYDKNFSLGRCSNCRGPLFAMTDSVVYLVDENNFS